MAPVIKKYTFLLLKIILVAAAFYFIYIKLNNNANLTAFTALLRPIPQWHIWLMFTLQVFLMLVNWLIEAVKWQRLMAATEKLTLWRAVESVFCGLTLAIFTPNRLGEYGGRVFFLSPRRRIVGIVSMAVGNIGQMVVTMVLGVMALYIFLARFITLQPVLLYSALALALLVAAFFLLFYFNIGWLSLFFNRISWLRPYTKVFKVLKRYSYKHLLHILGLCLLRYSIFTLQYILLFMWLISGLHVADILMMVCIMYLIQSLLPSLDLFDVGVRSFTAGYFFAYITPQAIAVMACTAGIWFINIILPAILGAWFVFKLNFVDTNKAA